MYLVSLHYIEHRLVGVIIVKRPNKVLSDEDFKLYCQVLYTFNASLVRGGPF